ncbi:MAG: carboxymuconolactone decarboxylase family protein [Bacteroidota bacterium]
MSSISPIFTTEKFNPETESLLETIKQTMNAPFTPNFFKVWGNAPTALNGIWQVMKYVLMDGKLPRRTKEMILVAIASGGGESNYCSTAHSAFLKMLGVDDQEIEAVKSDLTMLSDDKEKMAIEFAQRLGDDSNCMNDHDYEKLRSVGYFDEEIMEIIAMSGMAVFYGHLANATKINIDTPFQALA